MYRIYLTHRNLRAIRHLSTLPPPRLKRVYDKVRTQQAEDIAFARQKRLAPKEKKPRGNFGDRWTQEEFNEQIRPHMKQPTSLRKVSDSIGVTPDTLKRYMRKYGFKIVKIPNTQTSTIERIK